MNRRQLLTLINTATVLGFTSGCAIPVIPKRPKATLEDAQGWIAFSNKRYVLVIPRVEMGQNIATTLKQIACDALGAAWDAVDVVQHNTEVIRRVRATVGSESVRDFLEPLIQACKVLRERLGSTQTPVSVAVPASAQTMPIVDGLKIVSGQALYASDVRLPNMVYGRVLRAPVSPELQSTPINLDKTAAALVAGFVAVIESKHLQLGNSQGVGIVAANTHALGAIEKALNVQWRVAPLPANSKSAGDLIDIDTALAQSPSRRNKVHKDSLDTSLPWDIDLRIDIPAAAHASMEPRAATAHYDATQKMTLWVGSQDVFYQQDVICKKLGLDTDKVLVHGMRVGGAFGGKTICTVELEAAVLSQTLKRPVQVQWTREQEFSYGFHRPPSSHRIKVSFKDGRIQNWWHSFISSHILFTNAALPVWLQKVTDFIGDDGVARGAQLPYQVKAKRTEFDVVRTPVLTGPWRGLGAGPNVFAIESVMDASAAKLGVDPYTFRRAHLTDQRLIRVLDAVATSASWPSKVSQSPKDSNTHKYGRGIACGIYKHMSYAAVVADVAVELESGRVTVQKLWCAHDCGKVFTPSQVKAQCEGNLVWGIGMVLGEALSNDARGVTATNFNRYALPRMADVPLIEVTLIDSPEPPSGAGETAIVASGAAIANAVFNATGYRLTQLPLDTQVLTKHLSKRKSH